MTPVFEQSHGNAMKKYNNWEEVFAVAHPMKFNVFNNDELLEN